MEAIVRDFSDGKPLPKTSAGKTSHSKKKTAQKLLPDDFDVLKHHLSAYFKTNVQFSYNKRGNGKITIPFDSPEDLERIMVIFDKMK